MGKRNKKNNSAIKLQEGDSSFAEKLLSSIEGFSRNHANGSQVVTFLSEARGWQQAFDVQRRSDNSHEWGNQEFYRLVLATKLINPETYPLSIVVRTFVDERVKVEADGGEVIDIPKKEIRMFFLPYFGECHQLSSEDVFACMNTHAETGEPLPLDPSLEYCGEE